jgi:nickel-dependent lactate racemase
MIKLPYGTDWLELDLPEQGADGQRGCAVLRSRIDELAAAEPGIDIVRRAMAAPIGSPRLAELAKGKKTCTIIISDHTRPVPSRDILPPMLEELREGQPDIDITLLVATGFHRGTAAEELVAKLGEEIANSEKIVVHDCRDEASNVKIGVLPSGADLVIDRAAAECDLLVAEGFIEPHFFAGYSGGRKSVLPGVCDQVTVLGNHCSAFIDSPYARTGILEGNPLHIDMVDAARQAKLAYIVNVIIDENKKTVAAYAGDFEKAHAEGVRFLEGYCKVKAHPADIVITTNGGAPLDQNVYQSVKGLTAAAATAKEGGVLIMCAALADGHGGEGFYRLLHECESPQQLYADIMKVPQGETWPDQWEVQIMARILIRNTVIYVSDPSRKRLLEDMKIHYAADLGEALALAREIMGKEASITVVPNGVSVVVEESGTENIGLEV